jgi:septum formation protein
MVTVAFATKCISGWTGPGPVFPTRTSRPILAPYCCSKPASFVSQFPRRQTFAMAAGAATPKTNSDSLLISKMDRIGLLEEDVKLILASQSPRRREILDMMGLAGRYTVHPSPLDEEALQVELAKITPQLCPKEYTKTLAEEKAKAMAMTLVSQGQSSHETFFILGSDTIVDLNGSILNKPVDEKEAELMLTRLSGNLHEVHTGVALYQVSPAQPHETNPAEPILIKSYTDTARVRFTTLSKADIESYVKTGEPMDKAGSYGIQGIGGQFVEGIEGDFFVVMGLPMHSLSRTMSDALTLLD